MYSEVHKNWNREKIFKTLNAFLKMQQADLNNYVNNMKNIPFEFSSSSFFQFITQVKIDEDKSSIQYDSSTCTTIGNTAPTV